MNPRKDTSDKETTNKETKETKEIKKNDASTEQIMKYFKNHPSQLENKKIYSLTTEEMQQLLQNKKNSQLKKGKQFSAFVITNVEGGGQLEKFFSELKKNFTRIPDKTRFQLAVYDIDGKHWYSIDCFKKNDGLNTLIFDPAQIDDTLDNAKNILKKIFPSGNHYHFQGSKDQRGIIQYDLISCGIFTREDIACLARIEPDRLYSVLKNHADKTKSNAFTIHDLENDMTILTPLVRTIQSLEAYKHMPEDAKKTIVSASKNLSLKEWKDSHTGVFDTSNKQQHIAIAVKGKKYRDELNTTKNTLCYDPQGFGFISLPELAQLSPLLATQSKKDIVKIMKETIKDLCKTKEGWFTTYDPEFDKETRKAANTINDLAKQADDNAFSSAQLTHAFNDVIYDLASHFHRKGYTNALTNLAKWCTTRSKSLSEMEYKKSDITNKETEDYSPSLKK